MRSSLDGISLSTRLRGLSRRGQASTAVSSEMHCRSRTQRNRFFRTSTEVKSGFAGESNHDLRFSWRGNHTPGSNLTTAFDRVTARVQEGPIFTGEYSLGRRFFKYEVNAGRGRPCFTKALSGFRPPNQPAREGRT